MHFVLELIQNSDDNSYESANMIEPTLIFLIEPNQITMFNNEIGFHSKHINAICDVKASTKGKHQRGYIGRKGIGFKSVFTITDRPEIHSNGYHIQFNLDNGHIGYILPNWIGESSNLAYIQFMNASIKEMIKENEKKFNDLVDVEKVGDLNTCIHLPLKSDSEMQMHKSSLLTNNFNDIKPYLLLFLNRLRNLVIINKSNTSLENRIFYHREDIDENLVQIKSSQELDNVNDSSSFFLMMRENLPVPENLKPNDDVESTDLCLAFPLNSFLNINSSSVTLSKMDVFAYLPLRTFGFKFIIQADFVVPASRQDINQDSDWNQWIVKHIPNLFVKSLSQFRKHTILVFFFLICLLKFKKFYTLFSFFLLF